MTAHAAFTKQETAYEWEVIENRLKFHPNLHGAFTLEQAESALLKQYPGWFVYRGGNHVALHRTKRSGRLLLVVQKH
jgi:hypothetical protein